MDDRHAATGQGDVQPWDDRDPPPNGEAAPPWSPAWVDPETAAKVEPPLLVIDPAVPRSAVTILGGDMDLGKSAFVIAAAMAVATGKGELIGFHGRVAHGRAALFTFEDDANMIGRRLAAFAAQNGIAADEWRGRIAVECAVECAVEKIIAALGKCDLVAVDPFVYLHGADGDGENDNVQAAHLVHKLKEAAREGNSACLIVQHKRKDKNGNPVDDIRGASAFVGACRSTLAFEAHKAEAEAAGVEPDIAEHVVRLAHVKSNWTAKGRAAFYRRTVYHRDVDDTLGVMVLAPFEMPDPEAARIRAAADGETILAAFDAIPEPQRRESKQSPDWIGNALGPRFGFASRRSAMAAAEVRRIENALASLQATGEIEINKAWQDKARKNKPLWTRKAAPPPPHTP